ncbi:MAG: SDR family oxidoreductase [Calditrichaceae bacterium]
MVISILGCGWLGLPLAEHLIRNDFTVKGSTTREEKLPLLREKGIEAHRIILDPEIGGDNISRFFDSDVLILNIPPGRRDNVAKNHIRQIKSVLTALNKSAVKRILFVSSTSVYGNKNREVSESDETYPETESGKALIAAEQLLLDQRTYNPVVIRFAGLAGGDRNPGRFFAGKKQIPNGAAPVNFIHRDDCIGLIHEIIRRDVRGEIFNACSDKHPSRSDFYRKTAEDLGLEAPEFVDEESRRYKIINSDKIKQRLEYRFKYPDPMEFSYSH